MNYNPIRHTDYSEKMPDTIFSYDSDFYPLDADLPDPQILPVIPGKRVPIQKVGIAPVDLPVRLLRRDGTTQVLQSEASLYCSLDSTEAKGLNLSRLYLIMHDTIEGQLSIEGIKNALTNLATKQGSKHAYCKLRFKYPWHQEALRTRKELEPISEGSVRDATSVDTLSDGTIISKEKMVGHIAYRTEIEGQYHEGEGFKFYLTVDYVYSSTCPCSFELSHNARNYRKAAANAHSQRSIAKVKVQFDPANVVWIEDIVELCRKQLPTEVQIVVKRRDEQAFAELNGSNLLFSEDAVRLLYESLDVWYDSGKISDFSIGISHQESLHPWNAIAVAWKGIPNGLC
jgi:GTP cyclohydrolase I